MDPAPTGEVSSGAEAARPDRSDGSPLRPIVVAAGLAEQSTTYGMHEGVKRVVDVLLGCAVGLAVTVLMSRIWKEPVPPPE